MNEEIIFKWDWEWDRESIKVYKKKLVAKKTNNTNKLMQISYHSALTKIQKLQNLNK